MLFQFSTAQETKPLLGDTKNKKDETISSSVISSRKKTLFIVIFLLIIGIIVVISLSKTDNVTVNKKFNFSNEWAVLESIDAKHIPKKWKYDSSCDENEYLELTFAIKQQNTDLIHQKLFEVSDPSSSKFGQHWTMESIHEFLKPKDLSIELVLDWLNYYEIESHNIEYLTTNKDFIRIKTTVKVANEMLNTEYGYWVNTDDDKHIRVKDGYKVPKQVAEHLDFISPTLRFPGRRHTRKLDKVNVNSISDNLVVYNTPERLRSLYHMNDYIDKASYPDHHQCVASFLEEWFSNDDVTTFWDYFSVEPVDLIRVPYFQPSGQGDEAELDVQYITSTGSGIDTYVWDIEDDLYFITLIAQVLESENPPSVISMSYGGDEQSNGYVYCSRANYEFAKIGLSGITAFASSGDSGVTDDDECTDEFYPSFPASSPYVVAVGGTVGGQIQSDVSSSTGETAWIDSGGGFSLFFNRQEWQDSAVENYFSTATYLPESSKYNGNGRGYPDISAQSVSFVVCVAAEYWSVSGTSCSCPTIAGMFALINDLRLQSGKSKLGWVLPTLYKLFEEDTSLVNDIVSGHNLGCSNDNYVGFITTTSWDPVTGFGTPKFSKLIEKLLNV